MAHSRYRISHKKELYYIVCILAVLGILLISFIGPGGYKDLRKLQLEVQQQQIRVDRLERDNSDRLDNIDGLRSNQQVKEKHARENGYAKDGEIVYKIEEKQSTPKPEQARPAVRK